MKYPTTIIMAPLRGVTTYQFRRVYERFFDGIDVAMAPFIPMTQTAKVNPKMLRDLLPENNRGVYPIIPQVLGHDYTVLPPYLNSFAELGFNEVNWNLGCPAPQVTKKSKGSALIAQPDKIKPFLYTLKSDGRFKVTVKARLGLLEADELLNALPLFEECGVEELILHPRLASQNYSGFADRKQFKIVQDATTIPCTYNGDLFTLSHFEETRDKYNINITSIMMGRGLLLNPYLPSMIKGVPVPEITNEQIHCFLQELFNEYRESFSGVVPVLGRLKEYWKYLQYSFPSSEKAVKKIMKCNNEQKFHIVTAQLLNDIPYKPLAKNPRIDY